MKEEFSKEDFWDAANLHTTEFKVEEDPDQIHKEDVSYEQILKYDCEQECIIKDGSNVIGSTYIILTSRKLMKDFLDNEINERELLLKSRELNKFDCAYFCSAFIFPEYRRKGIIYNSTSLLLEKIKNKKPIIFGWTFSEAGSNSIKKTAKEFNLKYFEKKHFT